MGIIKVILFLNLYFVKLFKYFNGIFLFRLNASMKNFLFFCKNKKIIKIQGVNKIKNNKKIKFFSIYVKPGQKQRPIQCHADRSGMIILIDNSYKKAILGCNKAIQKVKFIYN